MASVGTIRRRTRIPTPMRDSMLITTGIAWAAIWPRARAMSTAGQGSTGPSVNPGDSGDRKTRRFIQPSTTQTISLSAHVHRLRAGSSWARSLGGGCHCPRREQPAVARSRCLLATPAQPPIDHRRSCAALPLPPEILERSPLLRLLDLSDTPCPRARLRCPAGLGRVVNDEFEVPTGFEAHGEQEAAWSNARTSHTIHARARRGAGSVYPAPLGFPWRSLSG